VLAFREIRKDVIHNFMGRSQELLVLPNIGFETAPGRGCRVLYLSSQRTALNGAGAGVSGFCLYLQFAGAMECIRCVHDT